MNGTLELVSSKTLQTRESLSGATSPLGNVQVTDELGLAYLDQDIDFGAVGRFEIFQNIKFILTTAIWSVPLDREFGMDYSMVDKPIPVAEAMLSQEIAMKIALYEPRARFESVSFSGDGLQGKLNPNVVVAILSTDELPSSVTGGAAVVSPITAATIAGGAAFLGVITGVPGPVGQSATVTVGETITGQPGTDADVENVGNEVNAVLEFTIPRGDKGDKGDQGTGVTIKGAVPTSANLPTTGNNPGDMWIAADTGHGWSWDGTKWVDVGPIQGPKGDKGDAATIAAGATTTGAAGTQANVVNVGTPNAAIFNFTIPQGIQGVQGITGQAATVTVGTTITGAAGTQASVVNSGTTSAAILNFTIPQGIKGDKGDKGDTGNQGIPGTAATVTVGSTTTGAAGSAASVTNTGTSSAAILNFTIPQGIKGDKGDVGSQGIQGIPGTAATIAVGTTATGAAGSNASVANVGSANAAIFNFIIPQGIQGIQGVQGPAGVAFITTTTANFTIPNIGSTVVVSVADSTNLAVNDSVYIPTGGYFYITAKAAGTITLKQDGSIPTQSVPTQVVNSGAKVFSDGPAFKATGTNKLGLLGPISGNTTDFVDGTNVCRDLVSTVLTPNCITTMMIADGTITNTDLAAGVAVANLGYTPLNKAGDTATGLIQLSINGALQANTTIGLAASTWSFAPIRIVSSGSAARPSIGFNDSGASVASAFYWDGASHQYRSIDNAGNVWNFYDSYTKLPAAALISGTVPSGQTIVFTTGSHFQIATEVGIGSTSWSSATMLVVSSLAGTRPGIGFNSGNEATACMLYYSGNKFHFIDSAGVDHLITSS